MLIFSVNGWLNGNKVENKVLIVVWGLVCWEKRKECNEFLLLFLVKVLFIIFFINGCLFNVVL